MRVQFALWTGLVLLMIGGVAAGSAISQHYVNAAVVDTQRHYRAELTLSGVNTAQLVESAQDQGYWIRIQTNTDVTYFNGTEPCNACDPSQESLFFQRPSLYVDGQNFRIRLEEEDWNLSLRPRNAQMPGAYEVIVSPVLPKTDVNADDLAAIDAALGPLSVLPMAVSSLNLTEIIQTSKIEPPEGAKIDSVLYAITVAPDWQTYASQNGITLSGLRVRVLIELASEESTLPESLDVVVESQSSNFIRAQVLVQDLVELSSLEDVAFVRLPSAPQPTAAQ